MQVFKNARKTLGERIVARGVTTAQIATLLALSDQKWLDEIVAVVRKYALEETLVKALSEETATPVAVKSCAEARHEAARSIMGTNFLGLEEVEKALGIKYTPAQRAKLAVIPFDEATLRVCAKTHVLVAGFPMSINDIKNNSRVKGNAAKLFYSAAGEGWYTNESFANASVEVRWFLLRKQVIANSTYKLYNEQLALIPQSEVNPWARDVVFATMVLFLTTGERLFGSLYVRCRDTSSNGLRVFVGRFDRFGLYVYSWYGYRRSGSIGVCSLRNS